MITIHGPFQPFPYLFQLLLFAQYATSHLFTHDVTQVKLLVDGLCRLWLGGVFLTAIHIHRHILHNKQ